MSEKVYCAEIISVGTELLLGHVANTDSKDISYMLSEIGINVRYHTVVGDNSERLRQCVEIAKTRSDIIITTGGLGPTCDDLTKRTLADAFGIELKMNEHEKAILYEYVNTRGFTSELAENHMNQALLPEKCTVFHNDWGTAPGCAFDKDGKIVIMVPGPPKECRAMFRACALPYLRALSDDYIVSHTINLLGIAESRVDRIFRDEMNSMTNPSLAPYAHEADCFLKVTAKASSREAAEEMIKPVMDHCCEILAGKVYGIDTNSVEEALFSVLKESGKTVAFAEGCTGGDAARRLTDLPGASAVFKGGIVVYDNAFLENALSVPGKLTDTCETISPETAKAMAKQVRKIFSSDFGVGIFGIAGPDGNEILDIGTLYIGLSCDEGEFSIKLDAGKRHTRSYVRCIAGNYAFDMVRRYIQGLPLLSE